jgi:hypothetical protein
MHPEQMRAESVSSFPIMLMRRHANTLGMRRPVEVNAICFDLRLTAGSHVRLRIANSGPGAVSAVSGGAD